MTEIGLIDLRSDVCLRPSEAMWAAMRSAEPGWPLFGEDPSVNALEAAASGLLGKAAAVFVPTCGQANLAALMTLGEPGQEVVVGRTAHIITSEGMGVERVAGLRVRLVADDSGWPEVTGPAGFLCLENTHTRSGGRVIGAARLAEVAGGARRVHLDGARLFNAAVALGVPAQELAAAADTVSISLNKGLGAPFGAILAGSAEVIQAARLNLKRIGGASVHGAGVMAAAGLVALARVGELGEDHRRAARLAELIGAAPPETNIVIHQTPGPASVFLESLRRCGVLAYPRSEGSVRFVTHRLIGDTEVERAAAAVRSAAC